MGQQLGSVVVELVLSCSLLAGLLATQPGAAARPRGNTLGTAPRAVTQVVEARPAELPTAPAWQPDAADEWSYSVVSPPRGSADLASRLTVVDVSTPEQPTLVGLGEWFPGLALK